MKYLKKFEAYSSYEEYEYYVIQSLKKYNIFQSEMSYLMNAYQSDIELGYEEGKQPFQIAEKIAKDLELDSGGLMQYKMGSGNRYQEIKYL